MPMDNAERTKWNAETYKQVKVYVSPELANEFKAACAAKGESMAAVLSRAMAEYCNRKPEKKTKAAKPDYSSREKRRAAMRRMLEQIEAIRDAEDAYKENIPENLQGARFYDNADQAVTALDEGIEALSMAFSS